MLNERNDKHEDQDDSEYHFSDEDVNYDTEPEEEVKFSAGSSVASSTKGNIFTQLTRSRRMMLVGVIFLILAFFLYKVVLSGKKEPLNEITPQVTNEMQNVPANANTMAAVPNSASTAAPVPILTATNNSPLQAMQPTSTTTAAPITAPTVAMNNPPGIEPQAATSQSTVITGTAPFVPSAMAAAPVTPSPTSSIAPQQPTPTESSPVVAMPAVIPVRAPAPIPVYSAEVPANQTAVTVAAETNTTADARIVALETANQKLIEQMHEDYMQRVNDLAVQSKAAQQQMEALSTRVAKMETQLSQILDSVTQNQVRGGRTPLSSATPDSRIGFTVQAIIPGRAWLKADNGETITVAEGDPLKEYGRITKIDPYDGIVEIDTGNKTVSLSYGSGG